MISLPHHFRLDGRRALVTGASRGIGAALALALADAGADVAITYAGSADSARAVVDRITSLGRRSICFHADLATGEGPAQSVRGATDALGGIDILVSNVAIQHRARWNEITRAQFEEQVATNWRSALEIIQLAVPAMLERRWGRILTIGSVQEVRPHPYMIVYAAIKCAQASMVRSLAKEFAPHQVTINNLAPGVILTDRNTGPLSDPPYRDRVQALIPAGFFGTPEDCAGAALLLCSDAGRYITGQSLLVDGGMSLCKNQWD
jgi:NAD(P)-dependent dehydrogenase (short-subunit alcohol dehydrogenase family)